MGRVCVAVRATLVAFVATLLTGCGIVKQYTERAYTEPWCFPKARIDHKKQRYYAGVKCVF